MKKDKDSSQRKQLHKKANPRPKARSRSEYRFPTRICVICSQPFTPSGPRSFTCSKQCHDEYNRRMCRDRARETAFLTPYDIDAFIAKSSLRKHDTPRSGGHGGGEEEEKQSCLKHDETAGTIYETQDETNGNDGGTTTTTTNEPATPEEQTSQRASVEQTMALPPSQRFQFSKRWSSFQRRYAQSIERERIFADAEFDSFFSSHITTSSGDEPHLSCIGNNENELENQAKNSMTDAPQSEKRRRTTKYAPPSRFLVPTLPPHHQRPPSPYGPFYDASMKERKNSTN